MYNLQKVNPENWQNIPILRQFFDDLPTNPYCTNEKGFTYIRSKNQAIQHRYIQPNHPSICKWLVFDIDDPQALFAYYDNGLPPPQFIAENDINGHAHCGYRITTPVGVGGQSSIKATRYLANVQRALADALGADLGYSGNLIKNPCYVKQEIDPDTLPFWSDKDDYADNGERDEHNVYLTGAQPSYTLAELSNNLDLYLYDIKKNPAANDSGYGRNCSTFYGLCPYGYALAGSSYSEIVRQLQPIADNINNNYDVPMQYGEVKHIVRSIARYCARMNFSESHKRFSELQAVRGARGGKVSKRPPVKTSESTTKPWLELNISRATYYRHKKNK
ncbi:replication initiation protein [Psychrobacter sp. M13]|uniref:replication initiation protein n=1 Tax=Psychrobacter sp. M13 TaxID=3067275 RepID=UPI00273C71B3|nr:replication initiation protein [Psychrobacter sp. M13]WLP95928.1 replication initiation protein [Psychrobacter sp. M13]